MEVSSSDNKLMITKLLFISIICNIILLIFAIIFVFMYKRNVINTMMLNYYFCSSNMTDYKTYLHNRYNVKSLKQLNKLIAQIANDAEDITGVIRCSWCMKVCLTHDWNEFSGGFNTDQIEYIEPMYNCKCGCMNDVCNDCFNKKKTKKCKKYLTDMCDEYESSVESDVESSEISSESNESSVESSVD